MKNKKAAIWLSLLAIVLVAVIGFSMAACGSESDDDGGSDDSGKPETAVKPTATPASGEVANNTAIALTTATAGAVIYYTQDGTEPNKTSELYSDSNKPVITTGKLALKAIAVKDGMNNSAVMIENYTIGTGTPPPPPDTDDTFTKVVLGDYNYFAGAPDKQAGWATDDYTDSINTVTKNLGLKLEDFQSAKYLVLELKSGGIKGPIVVIWGGYGEDGASLDIPYPGWMASTPVTATDGTPIATKGAVLTGNELKIELSKALESYNLYKNSELIAVKLIVQYYTGNGVADLIDNAYLLIEK